MPDASLAWGGGRHDPPRRARLPVLLARLRSRVRSQPPAVRDIRRNSSMTISPRPTGHLQTPTDGRLGLGLAEIRIALTGGDAGGASTSHLALGLPTLAGASAQPASVSDDELDRQDFKP